LDGFGLLFLDKDFEANLKRTDADGKGPNSNRRLLFWVTFRNAEEANLLAHAARVFEIHES
jgi:hypothetical protein